MEESIFNKTVEGLLTDIQVLYHISNERGDMDRQELLICALESLKFHYLKSSEKNRKRIHKCEEK